MKTVFTPEEIKGYFKGNAKHHFKDRTVEIAEQMAVHADGEYPEKLIDERRPNEPLTVKEYRKIIWKPITKGYFLKVFASLQKIRRSQDWSIRYGEDQFPKINENETLEQYADFNFPYFTSVTNWVFAILLRKYLIDPNAVAFVFPLETVIATNEYLKPFPVIFDSINIVDYKEEDFAVLANPMGVKYFESGHEFDGKSFYAVTTQSILKYDQVNSKEDFALTVEYPHGLGMLPVFKLGGILVDQADKDFLYESRLSGMISYFDEAVREYSDLQAAKVLHIYPERYEFTNNECGTCKGTGRRHNPAWFPGCGAEVLTDIPCERCDGVGYISPGPYSKLIIKPTNNAIEGTGNIPNPPIGYAVKDIDIVKLQEEGVDKHIYKALASVNFEFLFNTPLNQSGVAKEVDKDELNNTVNSIAEDIIRIMDNIYKAIARYRYKTLYSFDDIATMLPLIPVPEKFDLLSSSHTREELAQAKTNKINAVLTNALEVDYAGKRFGTEPDVRDRLMLILELDPLPNVTEDEKTMRLGNKGITQETYVVSSNIHEFVQQAIDDNPNFVDLPLKQQKDIIRAFAKKQITEDSASTKVMDTLNGLNPDGTPIINTNQPDQQQQQLGNPNFSPNQNPAVDAVPINQSNVA